MQEQNYSIKKWAKDDRPREKLLMSGPESLSHSELLAILIHNGTKQKSAVDLGKEIMRLGKDDLTELGKLSIRDFMKVKGIGEAKAITIVAALELGRRRQGAMEPDRILLNSSDAASEFLRSRLQDYRHEVFAVMFLNKAGRLLHFEIVSEGGVTSTIADPRIILKKALEENAVGIILSHNHPSGNLTPSREDKEFTKRIKDAALLFDISILDHIIVSHSGHFSFANEGLL